MSIRGGPLATENQQILSIGLFFDAWLFVMNFGEALINFFTDFFQRLVFHRIVLIPLQLTNELFAA